MYEQPAWRVQMFNFIFVIDPGFYLNIRCHLYAFVSGAFLSVIFGVMSVHGCLTIMWSAPNNVLIGWYFKFCLQGILLTLLAINTTLF
jgi:hypothetical protein